MKSLLTFAILAFPLFISAQTSERFFKGNVTPTWEEAVSFFEQTARSDSRCRLIEFGKSDNGKSLHLFVMDADFNTDIYNDSRRKKPVLLINNAIHPGEPCGVDASIQLTRLLLEKGGNYSDLLKNVTVCIIPMYNIGGALNRGCCSRANQNGPEEYGFRGNERNLDLNRDFVKCDSENASAFNRMFTALKPDLFVDTHTSNGADYQYTMTLISTQYDKAGPVIGEFMRNDLDPYLFKRMKEKNWEMSPYVETRKSIPDDGIYAFLETPRYSTGYAALFNTIGYTSEAHMLKPYEDRVEATLHLLLSLTEYCNQNPQLILDKREQAKQQLLHSNKLPLRWELDTSRFDMINFKGFEAVYEPSAVSEKPRLRYDQTKPFEKKIRNYCYYSPAVTIDLPDYYLVPQAWKEVVERLKWNNVEMTQLKADTTIEGETYYIEDFSSPSRPYEGHYQHNKVEVRKVVLTSRFFKGDYIIPVNQEKKRYIVETLEPQGMDSFFTWNFFDSVLQQKEWFSDYVFEDEAAAMLREQPDLRQKMEDMKAKDPDFAQSPWAQLYFLYQQSKNFEVTLNRYPIFRLYE